MKNTVALSPEQQRAKALYSSSQGVAMSVAFIPTFALWFAAATLFHKFGLGNISHGILAYGGIVPLQVPFYIGNWWARRQLQQKGLSQETLTVEVIPKAATHFSAEPVEWESHFNIKTDKMRLVWLCLFMSSAAVFIWYYLEEILAVRVDSAFAAISGFFFALGLVMALLFWFSSSPWLRIDATGVTRSPHSHWRRRAVAWDEISCCEIKQGTNIIGTPTIPSCTLKDERGDVLLKIPFGPDWLSSPMPSRGGERISFETEIKRWLTGAW